MATKKMILKLHRLAEPSNIQPRRCFSKVRQLAFPVEYSEGKYPNTILCHGLGSAWNLPSHIQMHDHVRRRGFAFTRFQYRDVGQLERTWHVNDWIEDIVRLLECLYRDTGPQILVASSAGAMAALRAALERPEMVESMLLLAPGVGLDLSYMNKIVPGSVRLLKAGKSVIHPGLKGGYDHLVTLEPLLDYVQNCPLTTMDNIPLSCPVRILHGFDDPLVAYKSSLLLAEKMESRNVHVKLIKEQGHVFKFSLDVKTALDNLLDESQKPKLEEQQSKEQKQVAS